MGDLLSFFAGLVCLLTVIAVVGHGIWVVVAVVIRRFSGNPAPGDLSQRKACPKCGAALGVDRGLCTVCGATPLVAPKSQLREELLATARQLKRLQTRGAISNEQYEQLAEVLARELRAAGAPASEPTEAPARVEQQVASAAAPLATASATSEDEEVIAAELVDEPSEAFASTAAPFAPASVSLAASGDGHSTSVASRNPFEQTTTAAVAEPAPPRPKLSDMLQGFLEESNIRWGEILAGFFIVVSSIGLVISLQSTLERIPYFPALLFTGFTVAFHGAGLYTLKRWNLHAISRVILVISLLLVPLTAAAAVLMSRRGAEEGATPPVLFWVVLAVGTVALSWVAYTASRELAGVSKWRLTIAVIGCSLAQVLVHRLHLAGIDVWRLILLGSLPLGCFLVASVGQLLLARRWRSISWSRAQPTFVVLGASLFAFGVAMAMLLIKAEPRWLAAARLTPIFSLAAGSTAALGLLLHRRTTARALAGVRTTGTVIWLLGGLTMLLMVALAWPQPGLLFAVGLVNAILLVGLAIAADLGLLYAPAIGCLALAGLIGFHMAEGRFTDVPTERMGRAVVEALLMGRSSLVLLVATALTAAAAEAVRRYRSLADARIILASGGGVALVGVLIALFAGFVPVEGWSQDRDLAAPVLLMYAAALLAAAPRAPWPYVASAGSAILFAALLQGLGYNVALREFLNARGWLPQNALLAALVGHSLVSGLVLSLSKLRRRGETAGEDGHDAARLRANVIEPVAGGAVISLVAAAPLLFVVEPTRFYESAVLAALAAFGWLAVALVARWKFAISGLQVMALAAPALAIAGYCSSRLGNEWYQTLDHVGLQWLALAVGVVPWAIARRGAGRSRSWGELLRVDGPSVDQLALGLVTVATAFLAWSLAIPGIAWELGYSASEPASLVNAAASTVSPAGWTMVLALAVSIGLLASLVERVRLLALFGFAIATFGLVAGGATAWESVSAVASATRWWAGLYAVVWGGLFIARTPLRAAARSLNWLRWERTDRTTAHYIFGATPILLGAAPVLILTIFAVAQSFQGVELRGPEAGSFFARIGPTASYAVPLLAIVGVFLGYALREREAAFAAAGSAVFQLAINLAFVLYATFAPAAASEVRAAECLQWNTLAAAGYAVAWLLLVKRMLPVGVTFDQGSQGRRAAMLVTLQVALGVFGAAAIACWSAVSVFVEPKAVSGERVALGGLLSYLGIALAGVGAARLVAMLPRLRYRGVANVGFLILVGGIALAAATLDRYDSRRTWLAYHALTGGWLALLALGTAAVAIRPAAERLLSQRGWSWMGHLSHGFLAALGVLVAILAIRGNDADPGQPWWSLAASLGVLAAATILGLRLGSQTYAYAAIAAAAQTMILFWTAPASRSWRFALGSDASPVFIEVLTLTLIIAAGFWQAAEIWFQAKRGRSLDLRFIGPRSHVTALVGVLTLYFPWRLLSIFWGNDPGDVISPLEISASFAVAALGVALFEALWDRRSLVALPGLFIWLFIAAMLAIDLVGPLVPGFSNRWGLVVLSAGLVVAIAGQAWSYGANLSVIGLRLGVSDPVGGLKRTERWLPVVTCLAAAGTLFAALPLVLSLHRDEIRIAVAFAPAAAAWGLACLADDERRPTFRLLALLLAGVSAVYLAWAQLGVGMSEGLWLTRVFRLLMVLSVLTFAYGLALPRWLLTTGSWNRATRQAGNVAGAAAIIAFVAILVLEIVLFQPGVGAPVDSLQVGAIAVVLVALIAGLISMALLPGRDPLSLSEKGKQVYVYAALATAALLFAHLYVCRPMWFDAGLQPYWPLIVMGIAFAGAGGGELFARYRLTVLAQPLTRVSSMLPLLPVIGMWVVSPKATDYALVLLVVGLLYLMLSITRRSWASLLAAAVAANGALWSVLNRSGFELLSHPQLWIIPPALSVLVAAHLNRRRLPPAALTSIRYACAMLIYVSSTSEIFLRGVATSLWPAMILATLSVAGAFVGMMLRIRAFLYLGASFALVSLMTMVAHAAQAINHVWPWWAFGVGMGIAILVLFGVFEKKREEMLRLIARLREWEQ